MDPDWRLTTLLKVKVLISTLAAFVIYAKPPFWVALHPVTLTGNFISRTVFALSMNKTPPLPVTVREFEMAVVVVSTLTVIASVPESLTYRKPPST